MNGDGITICQVQVQRPLIDPFGKRKGPPSGLCKDTLKQSSVGMHCSTKSDSWLCCALVQITGFTTDNWVIKLVLTDVLKYFYIYLTGVVPVVQILSPAATRNVIFLRGFERWSAWVLSNEILLLAILLTKVTLLFNSTGPSNAN